MRIPLLCTVVVLVGLTSKQAGADVLVDFNDLTTYTGPVSAANSTGSFENGSNYAGSFTSNGTVFGNSYNTTYGSWSGWSYSNVKDTTTTPDGTSDKNDYMHQYAAITQTAVAGSGNYGVSYTGSVKSDYINLPAGYAASSFYVTNTVYNDLSYRYGDGFANAFAKGDTLTLQIFGYTGAGATGTKLGVQKNVTLADDSTGTLQELTTWMKVDLSLFAGAQSLGFSILGADPNQFPNQYGMYGLNTPTYFAMDDLLLTPVPEPSALAILGLGLAAIAARRIGRSVRRRSGKGLIAGDLRSE